MSDVEQQVSQQVATPKNAISDEAWSVASSAWIHNEVRNSPISQSVEAWNHLGIILPKLRDYIETELKRAWAQI